MTRVRTLAWIVSALAVVVIVWMRPWAGRGSSGEVVADPRTSMVLRSGDGVLRLELERRGHGSWAAEMRCEDPDTGAVALEPRRVRSSHEPTFVALPAGTYRLVLDGFPRAGERGWRIETCGRFESIVDIRSGEDTRILVPEPDAAALILMVVDAERALARPRSEGDDARPDGVYLDSGRIAAAHEVVYFHHDVGANMGIWSRWSLDFPDEVSGPVPAGDFTLSAVARGRTLGQVPVKLVDGQITRVVLRVE